MTIEVPSVDSYPEIMALYKETWLSTYPNTEYGITREDIEEMNSRGMAPDQMEKRTQGFEKMLADEKAYYRVATLDGKIVGVCGGEEREESVHLRSIYILPEFQGKGVGSMLMADFLAWAKRAGTVTVHVAVYNKQAIAFYERHGFIDTGKRFSEERFRMKSGNTIPEQEMVRNNRA